jgi:hypothetical protein
MKHQWRIRRELQPKLDGHCRWDQAYQHLLQWAQRSPPGTANVPIPCSQPQQEVYHENSDLCARIDPTADADTSH